MERMLGGRSVAIVCRSPVIDSDSNGRIELTDGIVDLNFLFLGGRPARCMDAADADDDGSLGINDAILKFSYLFQGASPPAAPAPAATRYFPEDCGPDPTTDDRLSCAVPAATCT